MLKNTEATRNMASSKSTSRFAGLQLVIVQSSVTIIILIIVVVLKLLNIDVFSRWMVEFQQMMLDTSTTSDTASSNGDSFFHVSVSHDPWLLLKNAPYLLSGISNADSVPPLTGGIITSRYGQREDPFDETSCSYHKGVDIAASDGTPLKAFKSGVIIDTGYEESGYGHYVIVQCSESQQYLYAHCKEVCSKVGDTVSAGDVIAYVGNSGRSTGSHLHFEWIENGTAIDPIAVIPEQTYA